MKKWLVAVVAFFILLLATAYTAYNEADTQPPALPTPPPYSAGAVVIMCADTGMVLYGYEYHTPLYPASITKVMTALVVLDHITDLSERILFSHHAVFSIPRNSSHISMDVDESLTVYQALNALMLRSANEVAIALAEHVAGTEEEFVELMNHRAVSVGAHNTYFTNPTGLPGVGHVTTAYDMALIMREAVQLSVFTDIIRVPQFSIPPTERQSDTRHINTTNQLIRPGPYFDARVVGSKTGWTHAAGNTLVTYATHEGRRLIVTILQSTIPNTFRETTALLDFAFALPYTERVVFNASTYTRIVPVFAEVDGAMTEIYRLTLQATEDFPAQLPANFDFTQVRYVLTVQDNIMAPVVAGTALGSVAIYVQNTQLGSVDLLAQSAVALPLPPAEADTQQEVYTSYALPYFYDPYTANYYPLPYGGLPGLGFLRDSEQLAALAVPLVVIFISLLFAVFILVARRKRARRHRFHGYGAAYRYRA